MKLSLLHIVGRINLTSIRDKNSVSGVTEPHFKCI